jgi:hypothetical protein
MYARHKPGYDWKDGDDYPDYTKIKPTQSFNWSAFSIPVWTRFNDRKEYLSDYGIMGYSVNSIRNAHHFSRILPEKAFGLRHIPLEYNYSHCETYFNTAINDNINRREFRYILKTAWEVKIFPYSNVNKLNTLFELLFMIKHRFQMLIANALGKTS